MAKETPEGAAVKIEKERANFRELLLTNPNYFGQIEKSNLKAQASITQNTRFEELTCVGYNPALSTLEATFHVKLAAGYRGSLCQAGSYEYVRFFVDYGSGWQDAGVVATNVHDIPVKPDCAQKPDRPLSYVATLHLRPKQDFCRRPVLPRVRAILSWDQIPTAGDPNFHPVWGNVHECHIQIKPRRLFLKDIYEELKIDVPKEFEAGQLIPIPLPDPPPFQIADFAKLYGAAHGKAAAKQAVEPHRFGMADLQTALLSPQFDSQFIASKTEEWKAAGLNFGEAIGAVSKLSGNVDYEQIECLGLDYNQEKLVATFHIKKPSGYGGPLCFPGSTEYVAFWSDWDDKCHWKFEGCVQVNVHDIQRLPDGGLCYSAVLPVDLNFHRQTCEKPKIARIRAVLSWNSPPSATNPEAMPYWGNRMDTHVQIRPGIKIDPNDPKPMIIVLGGVSVDQIDPGTGLTTPGAKFALNNVTVDAAGRACPFAGRMVVQGPSFPGYKYRLQKRNLTLGTGWDTITDSFITTGWNPDATVNHTNQTATGELFTFLPHQFNIDEQLGIFPTLGDDKWEIRMEIYTMGGVPLAGSNNHVFQLANKLPDVFIEIASGGNCKTFQVGQPLSGTFFATAAYMGGWSLGTSPFAAPAGALTPTGGSVNAPAFTPWTLQTANMDPCGYVLVIAATDRVIVDSVAVGRTVSSPVGFCVKA